MSSMIPPMFRGKGAQVSLALLCLFVFANDAFAQTPGTRRRAVRPAAPAEQAEQPSLPPPPSQLPRVDPQVAETAPPVMMNPANLGGMIPGMPGMMPGGLPPVTVPPPVVFPDGMTMPPAVGNLIAWCNQVIPLLGRAQAQAMNHIMAGREREALSALNAGMNQALAMTNATGRRNTMTGRLLERGIRILREMQTEFPDPSYLPTLLNFASSWVNMTIRVSSDLDRPYFIPYHHYFASYCGASCALPMFDYAEFQRRYLTAISEQLHVITENLANGYVPMGDPQFFLRATYRIVWNVVSHDLSQQLYAYNYSCVAAGLMMLLQDIYAGAQYPDQMQALVWRTVEYLRDVGPLFRASCSPYPSYYGGARGGMPLYY